MEIGNPEETEAYKAEVEKIKEIVEQRE